MTRHSIINQGGGKFLSFGEGGDWPFRLAKTPWNGGLKFCWPCYTPRNIFKNIFQDRSSLDELIMIFFQNIRMYNYGYRSWIDDPTAIHSHFWNPWRILARVINFVNFSMHNFTFDNKSMFYYSHSKKQTKKLQNTEARGLSIKKYFIKM